MNDTTQTPTDQPSELDAIRARVTHSKQSGLQAILDRRRLLELLDEQRLDSERLSEMLLERFNREAELGSEIESLTRQLAEARENAENLATASEAILAKTSENFRMEYARGTIMWDYHNAISRIRSLKPQPNQTVVTSPESQLKEARELMREWYDGLPTYDLAWMESLKSRVTNFIEPNQKET